MGIASRHRQRPAPAASVNHMTTSQTIPLQTDVVCIGAGIMSATLAVLLKELQPDLKIAIFERLESAAQESSNAWNNAGTGPRGVVRTELHAGRCRRNRRHLPRPGGEREFDLSRQFWSYLVKKGAIEDPQSFIHSVPHCSFVQRNGECRLLAQTVRSALCASRYHGMEYSADRKQIAEWVPAGHGGPRSVRESGGDADADRHGRGLRRSHR